VSVVQRRLTEQSPNKALHPTADPLRGLSAGELGRWAANHYAVYKMVRRRI